MAMTAPLTLDSYMLDTLMRDLVGHDRRPSAFITYLAIVALAAEGGVGTSHQALAWRTGLSKRSVQAAVAHLAGRGLVRVERRGPSEAGVLTPLKPWMR